MGSWWCPAVTLHFPSVHSLSHHPEWPLQTCSLLSLPTPPSQPHAFMMILLTIRREFLYAPHHMHPPTYICIKILCFPSCYYGWIILVLSSVCSSLCALYSVPPCLFKNIVSVIIPGIFLISLVMGWVVYSPNTYVNPQYLRVWLEIRSLNT